MVEIFAYIIVGIIALFFIGAALLGIGLLLLGLFGIAAGAYKNLK